MHVMAQDNLAEGTGKDGMEEKTKITIFPVVSPLAHTSVL